MEKKNVPNNADTTAGADLIKVFEERASALEELSRINTSLNERLGDIVDSRRFAGENPGIKHVINEQVERVALDARSIDDLSAQLAEAQSSHAQSLGQTSEATESSPSHEEIGARLDAIFAEMENMRSGLCERQRKVFELEEMLAAEKVERKRDHHEAHRTIVKIADSNWDKDLQIEAIKSDLAATRKECERMKNQLVIEQRSREELPGADLNARTLNILKEQHNQELDRLRNAYRQEVLGVRTERMALTSELESAQEQIEILKKGLLEQQSLNHHAKIEAERALHAARAEYAQALSARDIKVQELESLRSASEKEAKRLAATEIRLKSDLERADDKFRSTETALRSELLQQQSECLRVSGVLATTSEQLGVARAEKIAFQKEAAKISELQQSINAKSLRIQELESLIETKRVELEKSQETDRTLREELARINQRAVATENELRTSALKSQADLTRIATQLETVSAQEARLRDELAAAKLDLEKYADLKQVVSHRDVKVQETEALLKVREKEVERLAQLAEKLRAELQELEIQSQSTEKALRAECHLLGTENSRIKVQLASQSETITCLRDEKTVFEAELSKANEIVQQAAVREVRLQELEAHKAIADNEIQRLSEIESRLRTELARSQEQYLATEQLLKAELTKFQSECSRLSIQINTADERIAALQADVESAEQEIAKERGVSEALSAKILKMQELEEQYQAGMRDVARVLENESRLKTELSMTVDQFRETEANLRDKVVRLQAEASRANLALTNAQEQVSRMRVEKADLEKVAEKSVQTTAALAASDRRILELESASESFEREIERLTATEARLEQELTRTTDRFRSIEESLRAETQKYQSELARISANFASISQQATLLRTEKEELERQLEVANDKIDNLNIKAVRLQETERQREALDNEVRRLAASETRMRSQLEQTEDRFRSLETGLRAELMKLQVERTGLSEQLANAKEQVGGLKSDKAAMEGELAKANDAIVSLRDAVLARQQEVHEAKDSGARNVREVESRLGTEVSSSNKKLLNAEARVRDAQIRIHELEVQAVEIQKNADQNEIQLRKQISDYELQVKAMSDGLSKKMSELQQESERRATEIAARSSDVAEKASQAEAKLAEVSEWQQQISLRENQLRLYSNHMTKEKNEIQKIAKNLVKEIKLLSTTHPLKDYLSATEFEVSKVELQLSATPTLAAERAKIEESLKKLIQQREFLKSILADAQKQFEGQAASLEKLVASGVLAPMPPPPPTAFKNAPLKADATNGEGPGRTADKTLESLKWEKPLGSLTDI